MQQKLLVMVDVHSVIHFGKASLVAMVTSSQPVYHELDPHGLKINVSEKINQRGETRTVESIASSEVRPKGTSIKIFSLILCGPIGDSLSNPVGGGVQDEGNLGAEALPELSSLLVGLLCSYRSRASKPELIEERSGDLLSFLRKANSALMSVMAVCWSKGGQGTCNQTVGGQITLDPQLQSWSGEQFPMIPGALLWLSQTH
ncbi:hypothetical protein TNCV_1868971 [Trichonephila clavipes]|nr:hypothetical protein TNCV_1868971 [Trichonephila clavipes]